MKINLKVKRTLMSLIGVVILGMSVGLFKIAAMGVDPFQALMSGLDALIPIPFGTLYVIVNMILLIFSLVFDRHNIGIATFINMFLLGYITEFTYGALQKVIVDPSMIVRLIFLVSGVVVLCFAASLYMTADMGVSTYDAVAIVCADKWKLGKFKYCRIATDFVCIIGGVIFFLISGGELKDIPVFVGVGTIVTAFFMGPLVDLFNRSVSRPLLYGKEGAEAVEAAEAK